MTLPKSLQFLLWVPALFLYGLITLLSNQPSLPAPGSAVGDFFWFKTAHVLVYGLLTFLVFVGWKASSFHGLKSILLTWYTLIILASLDELHQYFIIGRTSRITDLLIDLIAAWAVLQVVRRYNRT